MAWRALWYVQWREFSMLVMGMMLEQPVCGTPPSGIPEFKPGVSLLFKKKKKKKN